MDHHCAKAPKTMGCVALETKQPVPYNVIVDVSQNVDRKPWSYDTVPCLHKGSKFYFARQLVPPLAHFRLMGWHDPVIPLAMSDMEVRKMTGNMIAVPIMGIVWCVMFRDLFFE